MARIAKVSFTTASDLTTSLLNASTAYGTNDDLERHPVGEISAAIMAADTEIINAILSTPGHPRRQDYITAQAVTHTELIPAHIGPIGTVLVNSKAAEQLPAEEIERLRTNPLSLTQIREYYDIVGERLYFAPRYVTGTTDSTATVDICLYKAEAGMLQSPEEYLYAIVSAALALLFGKEGAEIEAAQHFKSLRDSSFEWIKAGSVGQPPEVVGYQRSE